MGNPLAPPLAHLFMVRIETRALNLGIRFRTWYRYVDDVYARISKKDFGRLPTIVVKLNNVHPAIQFTSEAEANGNLNYLQVSCHKETGDHSRYRTTVFRKVTHTNLYTRWDSAHHPTQKLSIFHSLLWTAKRICTNRPSDYEQEKQHLLTVFLELGYPRNRLQYIIQKVDNPHPKSEKVEDSINLVLPYIPGVSEQFGRAWKNTAKDFGLKIPTGVGYRAIGKLKSLLVKPYPRDPPGQGVYQSTCKKCGDSYIGETGLLLESRQKTHSTQKNSAIKGHAHDAFDWEFIKRSHNANERKIYESLLIRKSRPKLNRNSGIDPYVFIDC